MAKLTEQELRKELASGSLRNLYFIYGEEKYLVKKYTELIVSKSVGKTPSDFELSRLGSRASAEEILYACEQLPVFSQRKCVLVSDLNADALSDGDIKSLESYFSDVSPSTVLIFSMPTSDISDGKKTSEKKGAKLKKLLAAAEKYGAVTELQKRKDADLEKQLVAWAEKRSCKLSQMNASKIIAICGTDMTTLRNETDKLTAYADGSEITAEMINLLVTKNTEVRVYALSECIRRNDYNGAYKQLFALFEQNEKPEIILSVLSSSFADMYRMRVASESGKTAADVAADFKYGKRDFLLKKAQQSSGRYSTQTLRKTLDIIINADIKLKGTQADKCIVLESLLAEMLLAVGEGQK